MRTYDLSLRRKGALVTLEHAQTYLERMYGLQDPSVSEAHWLMMTCAKDVIRGARAYDTFYWMDSRKPAKVRVEEENPMELLVGKLRSWGKKFTLWRNGYCLTHLIPKTQQLKGGGRSCKLCRTEYYEKEQQHLQQLAMEVKYGL